MEKIYPFTILDVAGILDLKVRRRQPTNMDVDCPFCNHKKGKMNINLVKNVFRCNYCETSGGMIDLYAKLGGEGEISHSENGISRTWRRLTFPRTGFLKSFLSWGCF